MHCDEYQFIAEITHVLKDRLSNALHPYFWAENFAIFPQENSLNGAYSNAKQNSDNHRGSDTANIAAACL
jgi:hypothetical protein